MEKEQIAELAFNTDKEIKKRERNRRKLFILNILDLVKMYDEKLYKYVLGEGAEPKWAGYLADIEVYYSRYKIERWRKIINKLVKEHEINPNDIVDIPETRLEAIAKVTDSKEKTIELIDQARVLTPLDFKNLIRTEQGKPTTDDCIHKFRNYQICSRCGLKVNE